MRKLEIADADIMRIPLQEIVRPRVALRPLAHGLLLITGGQSCGQVAELSVRIGRTVNSGSSV